MLVDSVELGQGGTRDLEYAKAYERLRYEHAFIAQVAELMGLVGVIQANADGCVHVDDLPSMQPGEVVLIRKKAQFCNVEVCAGVSSHPDDQPILPGFITALPPTNIIATGGPHVYAHPASIYPLPVVTPPPVDSWVGTDADGYVSEKLSARIMPVGDKWWVQLGGEWLSEYGGVVEFPSARMAREQVERRREAERG
jgi:hypothetical protein